MKTEQTVDRIYMVTFTMANGTPGRHLFLIEWRAKWDMMNLLRTLPNSHTRLLVYKASLEGEIDLDGNLHPAGVEGA